MSLQAATAPDVTVSVSGRTPVVVVFIAAIGYAALAAYFSFRKHDAFLSGYDLANFDQELWLLAHGYEPLNTQDGRLFWGEHFSLSIALLTPLYVLGAGAKTLLGLQALTMAAVAPLLYAVARAYGARPWLAVLPALLWLSSPLTLVSNLVDVHHIPLAAPAIVGSVLALKRDRLLVFGVLGALACFTKEDVPLMYVMLGLVVALEGRRRLGAAISAASLAIFIFAVAVFMPAFGDSSSWFVKRFAGDRGDSMADVTVWIVRHPVAAMGDLLTTQNASVVLALLLMTGGLCLLAPRWMLLGLPALGHDLLSAYPPQHELGTQYFVPVALSFSIAAAVGVHRLDLVGRVPRLVLAAGITVGFVTAVFGVTAVKSGSEWDSAAIAAVGGPAAREQAIALIPDGAIVAATPRLSAHLGQRREIYALPMPFLGGAEFGADWSAEEMARRAKRVRWVILDTQDRPIEFPLVPERLVPLLPRLGFHEIFRRGSVYVYRRSST